MSRLPRELQIPELRNEYPREDACLIEMELDVNYARARARTKDAGIETRITAAIEVTRLRGDRRRELEWLQLQGDLHAHHKRWAAAASSYSTAAVLFEDFRDRIVCPDFKATYGRTGSSLYEALVESLVKSRRIGEAFEYAERARCRAQLDYIGNWGIPASSGEAVHHLADHLKFHTSTASQGERFVEYLARRPIRALSLTEIQESLAPDEALAEFFVTKGQLFTFVLAEGLIRCYTANCPLCGLIDDVREHMTCERNAGPLPDDLGCELGESIYGRWLSELPKQYKCYCVAHGPLHGLPLTRLSAQGFALPERRMAMLPSASALRFCRNAQPSRLRTIRVFADAEESVPGRALHGARLEAALIKRIYPRAELCIGPDATREAFLDPQRIAHCDAVHLAIHFEFLSSDPCGSRLCFAPRPGAETPTPVALREIYDLKLSAPLVFCSTCNSAEGSELSGEELETLANAFFSAGSPELVANKWKAFDDATQFIVDAFYRELRNGQPPDMALVKAQERLLHAGEERWRRNPWYWAGLEVYGALRS